MQKIAVILALAVLTPLAAMAADDLAVTVYNSNLGVISETRTLEFNKGIGKLAFRDVPSQIDASSVRFEILDKGKNASILEQNYAFDLVSPDQLYSKYVDNQIELIDKDGRLYVGKLLAYGNGAVTLTDKDGKVKIISLANIAEVDFPLLPEGLITRPTLFWLYDSDVSGSLDCRVGYQTSGMNWSAEYVGLLNKDESELSLSGWASINNTSGKTYQDAMLKLIAGDIQRATEDSWQSERIQLASVAPGAKKAGFEEKAFFEYHMYTLPRQATLANKEIKQISLFDPATAKVAKVYLYRPDRNAKGVSVNVELVNSTAAGLGMPLPAGRVRMFKADDDGSLILLGEDNIEHTPKDEKITLTVGEAFDVVGEFATTEITRVSKTVEERRFEIELRNRKSEDVTVKVEKNLWGYWEVVDSTQPYEQKDANTIIFNLPVAAESTAKITLTVRFTNR